VPTAAMAVEISEDPSTMRISSHLLLRHIRVNIGDYPTFTMRTSPMNELTISRIRLSAS